MLRSRCLGVLLVFLACGTPVVARGDDARAIALVDQTGAAFRISDLRGRPALITFVATRCTDACPLANVAFEHLRARLRQDHVAARLVTVTLDPLYVMSQLARSLHADPSDWVFASGAPRNVWRLMKALGVVASTGKSGVPDVHSTIVYLLDRQARLAKELLLSTDIAAQAERALGERSIASGAANDGR